MFNNVRIFLKGGIPPSSTQIKIIANNVKKHGGSLVESIVDATHLVLLKDKPFTSYDSLIKSLHIEKLPENVKLVHEDWLSNCLGNELWIPENKFEVRFDESNETTPPTKKTKLNEIKGGKMQEEKLIRNPSSKMVFIGLSLTDPRFHANVEQIKSDILSLTSSSSEGVDATAKAQKYLTASPTIKLHLTLFRPFDSNDNDILKINDVINHTATEHFNAPENANLIIEFTTIANFNKGTVIYLKPLDNTAITSIKSLQALLYTRFKDQGLSIPEPTEELHATLGKTRGRGRFNLLDISTINTTLPPLSCPISGQTINTLLMSMSGGSKSEYYVCTEPIYRVTYS